MPITLLGIRPYHAILMLVDTEELIETLLLDVSSTISRLLQVYSPLKSLQTMAADADLTLSHVMEIASHLVYWAQATVIYPLCESNVYVVASDIPSTSKDLRREFQQTFPELSLAQVLADFSCPMPLGERVNPILGTFNVCVTCKLLAYDMISCQSLFLQVVTSFIVNKYSLLHGS